MSDGRQPEVDFLHHWAVVWFKLSGQKTKEKKDKRQKKLRNTNLLASRHTKREKASLPIDVRRSKTPFLKLPNQKNLTSFYPPNPPLNHRHDQFRLRGGVRGGVFQNLIPTTRSQSKP